MSINIINGTPYLRTSRDFPEDSKELITTLSKTYIDISQSVNDRVIGLFPKNRASITGEKWYLNANQPQQTLRQVYTFTSTSSITHNIQVTDTNQFSRCFGSYTDGTNSYAIQWGTTVAIAGQITFYVTSTQIVFLVGAGAPALTKGKIVLEYLSSI